MRVHLPISMRRVEYNKLTIRNLLRVQTQFIPKTEAKHLQFGVVKLLKQMTPRVLSRFLYRWPRNVNRRLLMRPEGP